MPDTLRERLARIYRRANHLTGGVLGIIRDAFVRFGEARGSQADGELIGETPVTVELVPGAVEVVVPVSRDRV